MRDGDRTVRKFVMLLSIFGLLGCNPRSPGPLSRFHQGNQGQCKQCHTFGCGTRTPSEMCLTCHPVQAKRGYHTQSPKALGKPCLLCHPEHRGLDSTLGLWTTETQQNEFRPDHEKIAGFPLRGKHATAKCERCHKDLLPSGQRTYLTAQPDCQGCHAPLSPHGPLRDNECQRCHTDAGWKQRLPFDHQKETQYPLVGQHQKVGCADCHKDRKFRMSIEQYADCSPCHENKNPHGTRFKGQLQCSFCHTPNKWDESVFDHGQRTRFSLAGGHADKDCRRCHRGKGLSDFEDLRGLVTGSKAPFLVNCVGCHEHAKAHGGDVRFRKCLTCHDPGQDELKQNLNVKKMTYVGHPPGSRFPLIGGHDLTRMKAKTYCMACHQNVGQGFDKLPMDCFSCHKGTDQHRGALGKQCENCHGFLTGTWKVQRFDHDKTAFPLRGKHEKPELPCKMCHPSTSLATRFTLKKGSEVPACGDAACHKKDDTCHDGERGLNCGDGAGCHDPRDGNFRPQGRRCTKL